MRQVFKLAPLTAEDRANGLKAVEDLHCGIGWSEIHVMVTFDALFTTHFKECLGILCTRLEWGGKVTLEIIG